MEREKIIELLRIIHAKKISNRSRWVTCSCPFAKWTHTNGVDEHPSFGISIGKSSQYHCFACGMHNKLTFLPTALAYYTNKDNLQARELIALHEGKENGSSNVKMNTLDVIPDSELEKFERLNIRVGTINQQSIRLWDLRFDKKEKRIIFPIRDDFGRLVGIRGRFIGSKEVAKEKNIAIYRTYSELNPSGDAKRCGIWYGMHFPLHPNKTLVLVEGERDAILLKQEGIKNVWASMGASITKAQLENLNKISNPLVLFFDDDKAGYKARDTVIKNCQQEIKIVKKYHGCNDPADACEQGKLRKILVDIYK